MIARAIILLALAAGVLFPPLLGAVEQRVTDAAKRGAPVAIGDVAPDFTLVDQNGRKRSLSAERGKQPIVLVFYRGYW